MAPMAKNQSPKIIDLGTLKVACSNCSLRELCLPLGLEQADVVTLDNLIRRRRKMKKGEYLYRPGDSMRCLYAIRQGSIKTTGLMEDGRAQVAAFYLPGEIMGMDAISTDTHPCSAEALESTEVCEVPLADLEALAHEIPSLQRQLIRFMSREILRDEEMIMLLGRMTAEERLASCLLNLSQRFMRQGLSGSELKLSMSRQDLGDYLGLALETVSRLFSRFQDDGLISVHGRHIKILDSDRLKSVSGHCADHRSARI